MFRENVAALIKINNKFLGCKRTDHSTWQNVQGGIEESDKSLTDAISREIKEELGIIYDKEFKIIYQSKFWRRYYFPIEILKKGRFEKNIGQEQMWFLVELNDMNSIQLEKSSGEFNAIKLFDINELIDNYSQWKKPSFYDFCREINLII